MVVEEDSSRSSRMSGLGTRTIQRGDRLTAVEVDMPGSPQRCSVAASLHAVCRHSDWSEKCESPSAG